MALTNPNNGHCELQVTVPGGENNYTIFGNQLFFNFFGSFETFDALSANASQVAAFTEYYTNNMISNQEHTLGANIFASGLTPPDPINTPTDRLSNVAIIMIVLAIVLIIVIAVVSYVCYAKKKK